MRPGTQKGKSLRNGTHALSTTKTVIDWAKPTLSQRLIDGFNWFQTVRSCRCCSEFFRAKMLAANEAFGDRSPDRA